MEAPTCELPRLRHLGRNALPHIIEANLIPLALSTVALRVFGVWGALAAGLSWSYLALLRRLVRRRPIPGILLVGALVLTARAAVAVLSHSPSLYFLQPVLATVAVGIAFTVSVPAGRPLVQKLAADFWPLPADVLARPEVSRWFRCASVGWGAVHLANAGITLWLLLTQPLGTYLLGKSCISVGLTGSAIVFSAFSFRRMLHRGGVVAVDVTRPAPAPAPALALAA
jgi:uncharacterized membrane protein